MSTLNPLTQLNEQQQQIVLAPLNNLAVVAGPGSGKTFVIVHRIARLIEHERIPADRILVVTFTNKAANELAQRVQQLVQFPVKRMWLGTFHSIAYRLLRFHWRQAGLPEAFQILDADDQQRLIRKVQTALNLDEDKWPPAQSQWYINNKKDVGLRPDAVSVHSHADKILNGIYAAYEERCNRSGLVDFSELLLRSYELLAQHEDLLQHYRERFTCLLVDEFQDTNSMQYAWLKLLAGPQSVLMVVGDDDQSIYSWRGAQVANLRRFQEDFSAEVIRLEQNYRSTQTILSAANAVIRCNNNRFGKNLWTAGEEGEPVTLCATFNEIDEARFIVSQIKLQQEAGIALHDMAILYRSNMQSRVLEEELMSANIPYRVYGGLKFFDRAEIKDALAYLRLIVNPDDDAAFERVVNMPPRGIGAATLVNVRQQAQHGKLTLWQASAELIQTGALSARASRALAGFLQLIQHLQQDSAALPLDEQTLQIITTSGLYAYYSKDRSDKAQSRLENLQELVQSTQQYVDDGTFTLPPLQLFLSQVTLERGEQQGHDSSGVQLMTGHSAKGLQFEVVFQAGMEEGLFPHKMSLDEPGRLEEERRLFYVGMTRARKKLYLSYAQARRIHGNQTYRYLSRFVREIPADLLHEIGIQTQVIRPTIAS